MAWVCTHVTSYLIIVYASLIAFSDLFLCLDSSSIDVVSDTHRHRHRPPMVIPLHFSSYNYSSRPPAVNRRHLHQSQLPPHTPNVRMRLYDDLLSNGYYTTRLWIGSPPQEFALIVDSGSTVTYVPCSTCEHCGKHQDPRFRPELSTTYKPLKCNPGCRCDDEGKQCIYERRYAEMSSSSGVLSEDIISFGNESELPPQHAVFGCENAETGDLYSQRADGIMGLGRGRLSIVDQLVDKGVIGDSFSLCYGGMDVGGGAMVLGRIAPPVDMVFSRSDPFRSPYYNIELKELHVAGKSLKLSPKIFDGTHGTVLDSGTTYAYLPKDAFIAFRNAVIKEIHFLKQIHGPDPHYDDICFSGAGRHISELSKTFPKVDMVFKNGQKLSLSPENYLFRHTKVRGAYCLGIFENGDSTTLLGGIVVRNTLVTYDRENDKIGFWKTNCSELWRTLLLPNASAPAPSVFQQDDTNFQMPPNLAPSGLPPNLLPGTFRIGYITFDMSISMNDSDVKSKVTELAVFIAHELEIDNSQVRLLNYTSAGNECLLKWGIFPGQSANYISNATALNIILRLKEHRVHLPEKFGSYQLVKWNAEPEMNLNWWRLHYLAVFIGSLVSILVCLSTIGIWLVWRHRSQVIATYKPVGSMVPEQELQPL